MVKSSSSLMVNVGRPGGAGDGGESPEKLRSWLGGAALFQTQAAQVSLWDQMIDLA